MGYYHIIIESLNRTHRLKIFSCENQDRWPSCFGLEFTRFGNFVRVSIFIMKWHTKLSINIVTVIKKTNLEKLLTN